ncbi:MAG: tRNA 2-thiouridine(34) synthase MnmA [Bacteroidaceae bacterium]|nr:tRNA 2-thiouridine(34) synthase MnmA [Bacteroidaceae bacterium]
MSQKERILVGMSGGVDSSAVCMLLQDEGYEVVGLTLRMWDVPAQFTSPGQEEPNHILEARELAERLGIEHHTLDIREAFRAEVVQAYIDEYLRGRTPNPCVMCNRFFKWKYLLEEADRLHCNRIATGHYARIVYRNDKPLLACGVDKKKDQSYFLWRLTEEQLARTILPLGNREKQEIKEYVRLKGFEQKATKKESMEACFVPDDYRDFLREMVPGLDSQVEGGYFVDSVGRKLGQHKGYPFYTIGQRKGLEIALGHPAYVIRINAGKNTIRLGTAEELMQQTALLSGVRFDKQYIPENNLTVRIRYRSAAVEANIELQEDGNAIVHFATPISALTPGQSAVIYDGDVVIGGGIIEDSKQLKKYHNKCTNEF